MEPEIETSEEEPGGRRRRWWPWLAAALAAAVVLSLALRDDGSGGQPWGAQGEGGPVAVRAAAVEVGTVEIWGEFPGELVGEAADLAPRIAGRLQAVTVRPGERVTRGQVLAIVDPVEVAGEAAEAQGQQASAEANRARAVAEAEEAAADFARTEQLFREGLVSEREYDQLRARAATARAGLEAAGAQVRQMEARAGRLGEQVADTRVRSPFAGTVAARYLDPGAMVQPSTPVVRVVEAGSLLVQFRVPERELGRLRPGVPVEVTTQATGAQRFAGEVLRVAGEVSREDRSALVEAALGDPGPVLRPGMYAEIRVLLESLEAVVTVPGAALVERVDNTGEARTGVFTVAGDPSTASWRAVEVLGRQGDRLAVRGEIAAGEPVLTLGHEELADGHPVRVVEGPGAVAPPAATARVEEAGR